MINWDANIVRGCHGVDEFSISSFELTFMKGQISKKQKKLIHFEWISFFIQNC